MAKRSKYDTNPLDPDYARRTEEVFGTTGETTAGETRAQDAQAPPESEAPTRYYETPQASYDSRSSLYESRTHAYDNNNNHPSVAAYDNSGPTSYPSIFIPPTYQPPQSQGHPAPGVSSPYPRRDGKPSSRTVPGIGLPENVLMILPYLPFPLIGAVPGFLELLLVPRHEVRVRFNAAQGLALHLFVLVVGALFSTTENILRSTLGGPLPTLLWLTSTLFTIAAFIFFIISMRRVWKGEPYTVAPLADAARWLNEKVEPKK